MKRSSMKQLLALVVVLAGSSMLVRASQAACIATGEISRISNNVGSSNFFVRGENPGSVSVLFVTSDLGIISATNTAQASHMRVTVTGSNSFCTTPVGGASSGGNVITLTTAP